MLQAHKKRDITQRRQLGNTVPKSSKGFDMLREGDESAFSWLGFICTVYWWPKRDLETSLWQSQTHYKGYQSKV